MDTQKRAIASKKNYRQQSFWLSLDEIETIIDEYCLNKEGKIQKIFPLEEENQTTTSAESEMNSVVSDTQKKVQAETSDKKDDISDDFLVQSTYICVSSEDSDMGNDYIRFHVLGKSKKQIMLFISVEIKIFTIQYWPKPWKIMLYTNHYIIKKNSVYRNISIQRIPFQLELAPLPYGYQVMDHTDNKIILERKYVERRENISPKSCGIQKN